MIHCDLKIHEFFIRKEICKDEKGIFWVKRHLLSGSTGLLLNLQQSQTSKQTIF